MRGSKVIEVGHCPNQSFLNFLEVGADFDVDSAEGFEPLTRRSSWYHVFRHGLANDIAEDKGKCSLVGFGESIEGAIHKN